MSHGKIFASRSAKACPFTLTTCVATSRSGSLQLVGVWYLHASGREGVTDSGASSVRLAPPRLGIVMPTNFDAPNRAPL